MSGHFLLSSLFPKPPIYDFLPEIDRRVLFKNQPAASLTVKLDKEDIEDLQAQGSYQTYEGDTVSITSDVYVINLRGYEEEKWELMKEAILAAATTQAAIDRMAELKKKWGETVPEVNDCIEEASMQFNMLRVMMPA